MLNQCPACRKEVSKDAQTCPHCGYPIREMQRASVAELKPSVFSVVLNRTGPDLIKVIRLVRPQTLAYRVSESEADRIKAPFAAAGADVELLLEPDEKDDKDEDEEECVVRCPRCNSSFIRIVQKNDFDFGKAAMSAARFGPIGSSAGLLGTGETERVCANCGYRF